MKPPSLKAAQSKILWVGIDPGVKGAIGAINEHMEFCWVEDMPVVGEGRTGESDLCSLAEVVVRVAGHSSPRVLLEWPQTRPDEAPESSKRFGVGLGILEGMFSFAGCEVKRVAPNKWKGRLGLKGKEQDEYAARLQAVEMAEGFIKAVPAGTLRGVRGGLKDGRAEALMIAWEAATGTLDGLRNLDFETRMARLTFGSRRRRKGGSSFLD